MWAITMQSRHEMGDEERRGREGYYIMELRQASSGVYDLPNVAKTLSRSSPSVFTSSQVEQLASQIRGDHCQHGILYTTSRVSWGFGLLILVPLWGMGYVIRIPPQLVIGCSAPWS